MIKFYKHEKKKKKRIKALPNVVTFSLLWKIPGILSWRTATFYRSHASLSSCDVRLVHVSLIYFNVIFFNFYHHTRGHPQEMTFVNWVDHYGTACCISSLGCAFKMMKDGVYLLGCQVIQDFDLCKFEDLWRHNVDTDVKSQFIAHLCKY